VVLVVTGGQQGGPGEDVAQLAQPHQGGLGPPLASLLGVALAGRGLPPQPPQVGGHAALVVLLVALLIAAGIGLPLLSNAAAQQAAAEQQVKTAVQPGEDPHRGPAAMRKSGAEIGHSITSVFSILLAVFVPPTQIGVVLVPTVIAWIVSALREGAAEGGELAT
jgi:hypothetical protein